LICAGYDADSLPIGVAVEIADLYSFNTSSVADRNDAFIAAVALCEEGRPAFEVTDNGHGIPAALGCRITLA
jgi:hypothetical protein